MISAKRSRTTAGLAVACAVAWLMMGPADGSERFPGSAPSDRTVGIQQKAERLYRQGAFETAYRIWRDDLAEVGDKYAQYMVGYMLLHGEGTQRDLALAYAWYRLAAERGHAELVSALEELERQLTPVELAAGMAEHERLLQEYGDRKLVRRLIRLDEKRLRKRTGRVGASVGAPMTVILRNGRTVDATQYYGAIEKRLERRYAYLQGYVDFGELQTIPDELDEDVVESPAPAGDSEARARETPPGDHR